jgi:hypothetical protein
MTDVILLSGALPGWSTSRLPIETNEAGIFLDLSRVVVHNDRQEEAQRDDLPRNRNW